jgi:hypothetical protein
VLPWELLWLVLEPWLGQEQGQDERQVENGGCLLKKKKKSLCFVHFLVPSFVEFFGSWVYQNVSHRPFLKEKPWEVVGFVWKGQKKRKKRKKIGVYQTLF